MTSSAYWKLESDDNTSLGEKWLSQTVTLHPKSNVSVSKDLCWVKTQQTRRFIISSSSSHGGSSSSIEVLHRHNRKTKIRDASMLLLLSEAVITVKFRGLN